MWDPSGKAGGDHADRRMLPCAMKKAAARTMRTTAWEALGNMGAP